jgi:hypothetical protein
MLLAYGKNLAMTGEKKYQLNLRLLSGTPIYTHIHYKPFQNLQSSGRYIIIRFNFFAHLQAPDQLGRN